MTRLLTVFITVLGMLWVLAGCEAWSRWSSYKYDYDAGWIIIWLIITAAIVGYFLNDVDVEGPS